MDIVNWVLTHPTEVVLILTSTVTVASVVAQMTPNQVDDNLVAKVGKVVNFLALNWGSDKTPPTTPTV